MTDAAALLRGNRTRRRVRRIVLIASAPLLIAALALCGKLLSMYAFAHQSAAAYAEQDYAGTVQAARGQNVLNWFEPYKAPFNAGVGLADAGELRGARAAFEQALSLAHGLEQCAVRVNLAIVLERTGDAAMRDGDAASAAEAWQQALLVSRDAPPECGTPDADGSSPDPDRDMSETLDEQQQRLREKLEDGDGRDPQEQEQQQPEQQEQPDESELDDIKDRLEQGAQDRDARDQDEGGGSTSTDRPW